MYGAGAATVLLFRFHFNENCPCIKNNCLFNVTMQRKEAESVCCITVSSI